MSHIHVARENCFAERGKRRRGRRKEEKEGGRERKSVVEQRKTENRDSHVFREVERIGKIHDFQVPIPSFF